MKRLTKYREGAHACLREEYNGFDAVNRLAAYEDTGLEPEEVNACKVALMGKALAEIKEIEGLSIERMKELAKAEAEDRLLVLPCKVGDVLYEVDLPEYGVIVCEVLEVLCINKHEAGRKDAPVVECLAVTVEVVEGHGAGSCYSFDLQDFGKTVFLAREEAAEALRKEQKKEDE